jgi:hypothetical protein
MQLKVYNRQLKEIVKGDSKKTFFENPMAFLILLPIVHYKFLVDT